MYVTDIVSYRFRSLKHAECSLLTKGHNQKFNDDVINNLRTKKN